MHQPLPRPSIKYWANDDKPREKLIAHGRNALSNSELLAILFGSGSRHQSAIDLAQTVLSSVNNDLNKLSRLTIEELRKFKGIGEAKAVTLAAALELSRRRKKQEVIHTSIQSSKQAYAIIAPHLNDLIHEEFWVILLNRSNHVIKTMFLSKGGVNNTVVDKKIICKYAIEHLANAIILCHNHPSGNLNPSAYDIKITAQISAALTLIDVQLFDHLIVGNNNYMSFADQAML